jgi:anti-sigma factor RsiW
VGDDDLHAYADGLLAESRMALVEAHLAGNPEAAKRVQIYQEQALALRRRFDPILHEPIPDGLRTLLKKGL